MSKIIDIGIVRDNIDPLGIGRIRYSLYNELTGEVEKAKENYKKWSRDDKFVAHPLLPTNINLIPEEKQSVMIITFDTKKDRTNVFYIPGPFTTSHDFTDSGQFYNNQVTHTTYGLANDFGKPLYHAEDDTTKNIKKGDYINSRTKNSLAKKGHYGIYGKFGSDVIFTENGVNIRGGKLLSKEFAEGDDKKSLVDTPLMADITSTLNLKKFPYKLEWKPIKTTEYEIPKDPIKYMVEYSVNSFTGLTRTVDFFIYDTQNAGPDFLLTNVNLKDAAINDKCILLNQHNYIYKDNQDLTTPTFSFQFTGATENVMIDLTYSNIRNKIDILHKFGLQSINDLYKIKELHPFYFRPTKECLERVLTGQELNNKITIFKNIQPYTNPQNDLIYSLGSPKFLPTEKTKVEQVLAPSDEKREQSFASLRADKVFFLSTDTNEQKIIDFKKINNYEPTQLDYMETIEPNTFALVRGEILVNVLNAILDLFTSHVHNPAKPLIQADKNFTNLQDLITNLERDMLNNSIRIN